MNGYSESYTTISNFGILYLHFLSEGKHYALGVVSDLVGTDDVPELEVTVGDNIENTLEDLGDRFDKLLFLVAIGVFALVVFALWGPLKALAGLAWSGVTFCFEVVTFPLQLLFGRRRR